VNQQFKEPQSFIPQVENPT